MSASSPEGPGPVDTGGAFVYPEWMLRFRDWLILLCLVALAASVLLFGHDVCGGGACGSAPGTP